MQEDSFATRPGSMIKTKVCSEFFFKIYILPLHCFRYTVVAGEILKNQSQANCQTPPCELQHIHGVRMQCIVLLRSCGGCIVRLKGFFRILLATGVHGHGFGQAGQPDWYLIGIERNKNGTRLRCWTLHPSEPGDTVITNRQSVCAEALLFLQNKCAMTALLFFLGVCSGDDTVLCCHMDSF